MDVKQAYDLWAHQYDSDLNKTRDLEAISLRNAMNTIDFESCLEIGCGTGKNTVYLAVRANCVEAVDFSEEMLNKARLKLISDKVKFIQADITRDWNFTDIKFDLITFSLVLEHIDKIDDIFQKASNVLKLNGHIYVGELHPYKQYSGTKARFNTDNVQQILTCYLHNISEYIISAKNHGLYLIDINEYFDDDDKTKIPRILSLVFRKI